MYELSVVPRFRLYSTSYLSREAQFPRTKCTPGTTSCVVTESIFTTSAGGACCAWHGMALIAGSHTSRKDQG